MARCLEGCCIVGRSMVAVTAVHRGSCQARSSGFSLLLGVGKALCVGKGDWSDHLNLWHPSKTLLWALPAPGQVLRQREESYSFLPSRSCLGEGRVTLIPALAK